MLGEDPAHREVCESAEPLEVEDSTEATPRNDPIENSDPNEHTLPIDAHDQTLPIESTEPSEAMLRNESFDHRDRELPDSASVLTAPVSRMARES